MCVVCGVTGVGVLLILAKTVAQALIEPKLVTSIEKPEGTTVSLKRLIPSVYYGKNLLFIVFMSCKIFIC